MDDRRFDSLVQSLAGIRNRRGILKGLLGVSAGFGAARVAAGETDAARRGFSGPTFPTPTPEPCVDGTAECVIPEGGTSIRICHQGTWQTFACVGGQMCISFPNGNDFCKITN